MQLAPFMVMVAFTHLPCDVQSESNPDIVGEIKSLPPRCKENLIRQMRDQCGRNVFQTQLVEVSECAFKCGEDHNNGETKGISRQIIYRKDGTPCGHSKVSIIKTPERHSNDIN
ncbi:uncharacterized protein LOC121833643 [Ixodes scapularis]|uniref:uncharacterized protein LOC121833643 n=1 Tax=Ixodes scapularis TaxID=6945 RepID=UPI001C3825DB|nr:uncharacterized protein LOC121833643 [Ixodes scapularis]